MKSEREQKKRQSIELFASKKGNSLKADNSPNQLHDAVMRSNANEKKLLFFNGNAKRNVRHMWKSKWNTPTSSRLNGTKWKMNRRKISFQNDIIRNKTNAPRKREREKIVNFFKFIYYISFVFLVFGKPYGSFRLTLLIRFCLLIWCCIYFVCPSFKSFALCSCFVLLYACLSFSLSVCVCIFISKFVFIL